MSRRPGPAPIFLSLIATCWLAAAGHLGAQSPSAWRLRANDQFYAEWSAITAEQIRVGIQINQRIHELDLVCRFRVESAGPTGFVLEQRFSHVEMRTVDPTPDPIAAMLRGAKIKLTLSPAMKVEKVEGLDSLVNLAPGQLPLPPQEAAMQNLERMVRDWASLLFLPVPEQYEWLGGIWTRALRHAGHPPCDLVQTFSEKAPSGTGERKLRHFAVSGTRKLAAADGGLPAVESLELHGQEFTGELVFDADAGRLGEFHYSDRIELKGVPRAAVPGPRSLQGRCRTIGVVRVTKTNPLEPTSDGELKLASFHKQPADGPKEWANSLGMKMVRIPAGKFMMGGPASGGSPFEAPHEVEIARPFAMGAHEVTIGQYRKFIDATGYKTEAERNGVGCFGFNKDSGKMELAPRFSWSNPGWDHDDRHPAVNLTWEDARAFCTWLSKTEKKKYRLPTEAEWEYAARAGTKTAYFSGEEPESLAKFGNIVDASAKKVFPQWQAHDADDGFTFTAPVGSFRPNAFGLYDMIGNALEWCEDWFWLYPTRAISDPTGPALGAGKVQRGGSFADFPQQSTCFRRTSFPPDQCCVSSGFRVVVSDTPAPPYAATPTWRGRKVMPREGRQVATLGMRPDSPTPPAPAVFLVTDDQLGLLRVRISGADVGTARDEVVPLDEAESHYTKRIDAEDTPELRFLRAEARRETGNITGAVEDLDEALKMDQHNPWLRIARARLLTMHKRYREAGEDFAAAVELRDDNPFVRNALAWFLATCPDAKYRDGKRALEHARKAYDLIPRRDGSIIDTLAAAYAENGDFDQAIHWEHEALKDSRFRLASGEKGRARIEQYRQKKPLRGEE